MIKENNTKLILFQCSGQRGLNIEEIKLFQKLVGLCTVKRKSSKNGLNNILKYVSTIIFGHV